MSTLNAETHNTKKAGAAKPQAASPAVTRSKGREHEQRRYPEAHTRKDYEGRSRSSGPQGILRTLYRHSSVFLLQHPKGVQFAQQSASKSPSNDLNITTIDTQRNAIAIETV